MEQSLFGKNIPVDIEQEIKKSYLDYAMSVIIGRAIPDVRDGLKPVHRRVLYAMFEMGNRYNKPYKKSARIVGDIIGKYHPHGDAAVYDTIVRMAQEFSMRYPLIDGQGNFGSIDGDPPAAMRYTEIRLTKLAEEILADLDKETVDFGPNYDDSLTEPLVLATKVPLLMLNGSSGIAVGMATNIPPHNLAEVIDGTIHLIKNPDAQVEELMQFIKGPDFPTYGFINGLSGIAEAYKTGRGIIKMRARAIIERKARSEKESIVITEIPYLVNKAAMIEKISELVREKKITGISDIRDESDREGIRVVIDVKRDEAANVVLNQLYKLTQMESTFGIIMLAIENGQPKLFNLKEMLQSFINFRKQVVIRRTSYELKKAEERAHVLDGLLVALRNIDAVVAIVKGAKGPKEAQEALMVKFGLSDIQAQAILEMRLQRLTSLEREKIEEEYRDLVKQIAHAKEILADPKQVLKVIIDELEEIKEKYQDPRRTEIVADSEEIALEDLIVEEDVVVTITHAGYIKRTPLSLYRSQHRGGRGKISIVTKEEDFLEKLFVASTHHYILIFTNIGRLYWLKVHQIPEAGRATRGKAIVNLVNLQSQEKVATVLPIKDFTHDKYVVMATRKGMVKKTFLTAYANPRPGGIIAITIAPDDQVIDVHLTGGNQEILLCTKNGRTIRFSEETVRPTGRTSQGVVGIRLEDDDHVVGMEVPIAGCALLTVSERGFGKRTPLEEYPLHGRGGKGILNLVTSPKVGSVAGILQVHPEEDIMLISDKGKLIRMGASEIPLMHRRTRGVKLIELGPEERMVGLAKAEKDNGKGGEETDDLPKE